jgi:hypothetical protein
MSNVVRLDSHRPSRFNPLHGGVIGCDCAACDVRRMGRAAEKLRDEAQAALLVDGVAVAERVDEIVHHLAVLCGFECQRRPIDRAEES